MPLQPACRDHHTLPPPGRKTTGSGRVRASLAHEPPQQAAQAILRQAPAGARPGRLLGCEPEPVTFAEDQPLDAGPVACPERRRSEEHTSELQSLAYIVCRLLLEKKTLPTDTTRSKFRRQQTPTTFPPSIIS